VVVHPAYPRSATTVTVRSVDRTLAALSDPTRRGVVDLLRRKPHRAGELAAALAVSAPALSRHLRLLRKGGLIVDEEVEEDARVRMYRLRPEAFVSLRQWLDEVESFWADQLQSFKSHADAHANRRKR
jgi:DNA-binding transcriptional ArsR family regulator